MYEQEVLKIRKEWNFEDYEWNYSVVDFIALAMGYEDYDRARKYWNKFKERLSKTGLRRISRKAGEGEVSEIDQIELVTKVLENCHQLKMPGKDGKLHPTDALNITTLHILLGLLPQATMSSFMARYERVKQELKNPSLVIDY